MKINNLQFAYRIEIDSTTKSNWESYVFDASYSEYLLQEQLFNSKENPVENFRELLQKNPKAKELNFLVGASILRYIEQLNGNLYQVRDVLNKNCLKFDNFELDVVSSSNRDKTKHKIGITFYSKVYDFLGMMNENYLISDNANDALILTKMYASRPYLSIAAINLKDEN